MYTLLADIRISGQYVQVILETCKNRPATSRFFHVVFKRIHGFPWFSMDVSNFEQHPLEAYHVNVICLIRVSCIAWSKPFNSCQSWIEQVSINLLMLASLKGRISDLPHMSKQWITRMRLQFVICSEGKKVLYEKYRQIRRNCLIPVMY